jgi:hypothetical protein
MRVRDVIQIMKNIRSFLLQIFFNQVFAEKYQIGECINEIIFQDD